MFNIVELNTTAEELKPVNEEITKDIEEKPRTETSAIQTTVTPKGNEGTATNVILSLTKEVELPPIVMDPSLKLNRTFRKMVPSIEKLNTTESKTGNLNTTIVRIVKAVVSSTTTNPPSSVPPISSTEQPLQPIPEEPKKPNRKRILFPETKNSYPSYLGRVVG